MASVCLGPAVRRIDRRDEIIAHPSGGRWLRRSMFSGVFTRPRVKAVLDRITGMVLIGLGVRLALERR